MLGESTGKNASTTGRYRICFFDYKHDFHGTHSFGGLKYGYFTPKDELVVPGWAVANEVAGEQQLQLEVIKGGEVLNRVQVDFLDSEDVRDAFPELPQAVKARFKLNLPLDFLKDNEYVLRLSLLVDEKASARLWDLALIRDEVSIKPVFVVGSPRAGTTAVGNALRVALGAKNYGEHHFLFLANKLENTVNDYFASYHTRNDSGTFLNDVSPALVFAKISQQIKDLYCSWQPGEYFVDKTPGRNMLESITTIQKIWPEAIYIFCKRRAYENVKSRLIKFPHLSTEQHAKQWVEVMALWRGIKKFLSEESYVEIDQSELQRESNDFLSFIDVYFDEDVRNKIIWFLNNNSPQKSDYSEISVDKEKILKICREEMELWGYEE
jgi:hypothetical protein